jgi:hypothetical protein
MKRLRGARLKSIYTMAVSCYFERHFMDHSKRHELRTDICLVSMHLYRGLHFFVCNSVAVYTDLLKVKAKGLATKLRLQVKEVLMMKCVTLLVITRHTSRYTTMRWFYTANKSLCPFSVPVESYHETCRKNSLFNSEGNEERNLVSEFLNFYGTEK